MPPTVFPETLRHQYADLNGLRMHYAEAGQGDTVLLLHGFPESWYSWRHQLAALAPHFHAVAPDLRGYNETEARGPYDTATIQRDVLGLAGHLGDGRVHVVGHDWGGVIAWLLAIHHPDRVRTLTVLNAPHPALFARGVRRPRQLLRSWYMLAFQVPWLPERALAFRGYHTLARAIINDTRPGTFTRADVKFMLAAWRRQGLAGPVSWYRAAFWRRIRLPRPAPVVQCPTLVIWGEDDAALGKELNNGLDALVRDLDVHTLPNVGHWVQQEEPERVNALLLAHLQRSAA